MKLCSACLLGIRCRYDGRIKLNEKVVELSKKEILIPICPEQLGGLSTPRIPQEIQGCSGEKVLNGECKVLNKNNEDVADKFIKGAEETFKIAQLVGAKEFIGKSKSPSCGCGQIYDGTFSGKLIKGNSVTAALLKRSGIKIISEEDL